MTIENIRKIISTDETRTLEMKKTTGELKDGMHSACAFLNTGGGWLFFGIAPTTLKIIGQQVTDKTRQEIGRAIKGFEPAIDVPVEYVEVPNHPGNVVVAMHFDGWVWGMKPYTFHGCPYIRVESTTSVMPSDIYEERLRECRPMEYAWENLTTLDTTLDNIDENRVMGIARAGIREGRMPETALEETVASLLNRWGLIVNGKPTNGALALFAKDAGKYSQLRLQMAKFKGTESIEFLDNQRLTGNIFELFDGAMAFCFKHLNLSGKVIGLKRNEELEIPYEALREGVINALCHRRYDDYKEGLQLGIYDDRVEICNPGRFPVGVTPENIKTLHSSKPRNLHIAQVMYKAAYLEGWGTGIKRMIDVCKAHNLPEPFYQIWADGTIVLVFQRPEAAKNGETNGGTNGETNGGTNDRWESLTERRISIIQCLQKNGTHSSRTLSALLEISQRTIEREISFLRKNGFIDKEGSTKNGIWKVLK